MKTKLNQFVTAVLLTVIGITISMSTVEAQNARFATQGIIEFEKKINMYALVKEEMKRDKNSEYMVRYFEEYQKNQPQFKILKSTLTFNKDQTLFRPIEPATTSGNYNRDYPIGPQNNIIYSNTQSGTSIAQKKVFEETYLVNDSSRKINWKITSEIRNIAGYDCRRANALIMDSLYVVAFYTDEIPVSGGPESFSGLPGMILGVALPYEHVTWFATGVLDQAVPEDKVKAPVKGKPTTNSKLAATLKAALKDWGSYAKESLKAFML